MKLILTLLGILCYFCVCLFAAPAVSQTMVKAKLFAYVRPFEGEPQLSNFALVQEVLPDLKEGEFLIEALYLSVDPYMIRGGAIGSVMIGGQVAKVIESKNDDFPVDSVVFAQAGWRSHTVVNPKNFKTAGFEKPDVYILPDFKGLPLSLSLGYLGMPGNSGYFGFLEICRPKNGEVVVVTAAAGAVGSLVGQIAKLKGCRVIGFAGSDEKCKWLEQELGFDKVINYKKGDIGKQLKQAAPNGIDCFFDNVGGELSVTIIKQMNQFGRVSICGAISGYTAEDELKVSAPQRYILWNQLRVEGFRFNRWLDQWYEGLEAIRDWIVNGNVKYHETIIDGFENTPRAFIDIFRGLNTGKVIVKV